MNILKCNDHVVLVLPAFNSEEADPEIAKQVAQLLIGNTGHDDDNTLNRSNSDVTDDGEDDVDAKSAIYCLFLTNFWSWKPT